MLLFVFGALSGSPVMHNGMYSSTGAALPENCLVCIHAEDLHFLKD